MPKAPRPTSSIVWVPLTQHSTFSSVFIMPSFNAVLAWSFFHSSGASRSTSALTNSPTLGRGSPPLSWNCWLLSSKFMKNSTTGPSFSGLSFWPELVNQLGTNLRWWPPTSMAWFSSVIDSLSRSWYSHAKRNTGFSFDGPWIQLAPISTMLSPWINRKK